jgi:hypothetical protein
MEKKESTYQCPICKGKIEAEAGEVQVCTKCSVVMVEVKKGIITK